MAKSWPSLRRARTRIFQGRELELAVLGLLFAVRS